MSKIKNGINKEELDLTLQSIKRLLVLIASSNREIELSEKIKSDLLVRQALHLKKEYTKELLELLQQYKLPVQLMEAA